MFHIVSSCPETRLEGGLPQLHLAEDAAVQWLMSHGLCNNNSNNNHHHDFILSYVDKSNGRHWLKTGLYGSKCFLNRWVLMTFEGVEFHGIKV